MKRSELLEGTVLQWACPRKYRQPGEQAEMNLCLFLCRGSKTYHYSSNYNQEKEH